MAADFDSYKSKLPEVSELLDRIKAETKDQLKALKYISEADQAINAAKSVLTDDYFKHADIKELMRLSNPWTALDTKILKRTGVKNHLDIFLTGKRDKIGRFARQIWRTQMVSFLMERLAASGRTDINLPHVVERIMAGQIVGEEEDEPKEVVEKASWLDSILKSHQAEVIKGMESSKISCKPAEIPANFSGRKVQSIKVIVGGAFLGIPEPLTSEFKFKHMWSDGNRIYAQMENGCKGNLAIIELEPPSRKPPEEPPFSLDEIKQRLLTFNHSKFDVSKKAIFKSGALISKTREMEAPQIIQNDGGGKKIELDSFYILRKRNRENPPYFLVVNRTDPYEIGIGKVDYEHGFITSSAIFGTVEKKVQLDKSSRKAAEQNLKSLFDSLP